MTDRAEIFPHEDDGGLWDRVLRRWDFSALLPVPARPLDCPVCGGSLRVKDWHLFTKNDRRTTTRHRADVRAKCLECSLVLVFGVAVPPRVRGDLVALGGVHFGVRVPWRDGAEIMARARAWLASPEYADRSRAEG